MTQVSSLYLHVPFCRHLCNYCDFYKTRLEAPAQQFEDFHRYLKEGMLRHERLMEEHNIIWGPLESIYLGGGTPSLWGPEGAKFFQELIEHVPRARELEFTMEVDPGTWSHEMIMAWQEVGMNRISVGSQTLDSNFLKIMDRGHSLEETYALLAYCRDRDLNFSLDFLLGIPFSVDQFRNIASELESFMGMKPKHVSLYILNARLKYPHVSALPDDEFIRQEYLQVSDYLRDHGFSHYEVSNFALPGYESKHNLKYWRSESVAALGPTGTGLFVRGPETAFRYKWKVTSAEVEIEKLGKEELDLERTYLSLRTSDGWVPPKMTDQLNELLKSWDDLDYGRWNGSQMILNSQGFLMLDSLMDDLFRLAASEETPK